MLRMERVFLGDALHAPVRGQIELLHDAFIRVGGDGRIVAIHCERSVERDRLEAQFAQHGALVRLKAGQYFLPGLVDLHIHAPQWPQRGQALDLPLEEWLQTHTFPLEARYADTDYARHVYRELVDALLANGTTTAAYFGSIHLAATRLLAEICLERSQRALIGRVAMDDARVCPPFYRDPCAEYALEETATFIEAVRALPGNRAGLVEPVITPRFIPACTDELLRGLGTLARESGCRVQTHCSESDWEHGYVLDRCGCTDTAALDRFGLLTRGSVLAHGNFLTDPDLALIRERGAVVAHCPLSNVFFSDAVFPLRRVLEAGVHVGLGTDIAGGASPSILENVRHAVISSRLLESGVDAARARPVRQRPGSRIDVPTAFHLATAGAGIALNLPVGVFREGFEFDALLIDGTVAESNLRLESIDRPEEILQKIVYHAARTNIRTVWIAGRPVYSRAVLT
jgi:guanine deaminase